MAQIYRNELTKMEREPTDFVKNYCMTKLIKHLQKEDALVRAFRSVPVF